MYILKLFEGYLASVLLNQNLNDWYGALEVSEKERLHSSYNRDPDEILARKFRKC